MRSAFILTVVFAVLKMTSVITWSWLWVLSPLPITAVLLVTAGIAVGVVTQALQKSYEKSVRQNLQVVR